MEAERFYLKHNWYNEFSLRRCTKYYNLLVHLRHIYYTDTCKVYKNQL